MELMINDLVSSIKKDGIDAANAKSEEIIASANEKASEIISKAQKEAEQIKAKAENEISILQENAQLNIEHAERDAMLSFKKAVQAEYVNILSANIKKELNGKTVAELIKAALNGENPADYEAQVSEVTEALKSELAKEIKDGLEIRPTPSVHVGFRLADKDGSGYFDCSDDEIIKMLEPYFPELNI